MNAMERVEKYVCDGLVLDDNGQWVPIKQMITRERRFLAHLAHGEVISAHQWIPIARAQETITQQSSTPQTTPSAGSMARTPDIRSDLIAALTEDDDTSSSTISDADSNHTT